MAHSIAPPGPQPRGRIGTWLKKPLAHKLHSLAAKGQAGLDRVADNLFEKRHRLDCGGFIPNTGLETAYAASQAHSRAYEAVRCREIGSLLDEARKTGIAFDNFIDIGSGKGKACFYAASKRRFTKIIGVEFSRPLVDVANANKKSFGAHDLSFINIDATLYFLPPGDNLVFLFNPFGEVILRQFVQNNLDSFRQSRSVIAYANDQHRLCLANLGFSTISRNQDSQCSLHQYLEHRGLG
jgi:SAM-dependent methyltransferase